MPLPETIPVRYSEEEAEYLSVRPVVRQNFRVTELVDMILSVTGKEPRRIQQILRAGSVVYHTYRYWWEGFEASGGDLDLLLREYPDADPRRIFRADECAALLLESGGPTPRHSFEVTRKTASQRRLLRRRSLWQAWMQVAQSSGPAYLEYSYARRADLYQVALDPAQAAALAREAQRLAPRRLRAPLRFVPEMSRMILICPRPESSRGL